MKMRSLTYSRGNPYLLMLGLGILGSGIMFFFLALLFVRKMSLGPESFSIPPAFGFSTITLVLSSVSLTLANQKFKKEQYRLASRWCRITLILAVGFCILQGLGWQSMFSQNFPIHKSFPAFVFLFTGLHFLHIVLGILGLIVVTLHAHQNQKYVDGYIQTLNPAKQTFLKMTTWFWHFLDILWLILFALIWGYSIH